MFRACFVLARTTMRPIVERASQPRARGETTGGSGTLRDQILRDYRQLEPGQGDSWNPVRSDIELGYRMGMFFALAQSLRLCQFDLADLRVLDVGSGNGRSTRVYIDLGLKPEQLVGIDFRDDTIELARALHPKITAESCESDRIDYPDGSFNWVQAATVFSSIADHRHRHLLAREMVRSLADGGYLFYFDLRRANRFAGNDVIDVGALFAGLTVVWSSPLQVRQCFPRVDGPSVADAGRGQAVTLDTVQARRSAPHADQGDAALALRLPGPQVAHPSTA